MVVRLWLNAEGCHFLVVRLWLNAEGCPFCVGLTPHGHCWVMFGWAGTTDKGSALKGTPALLELEGHPLEDPSTTST